MYLLDIEKARTILLSQNVKPYQIELLLNHYPPLEDSLENIVEQWLLDQSIHEVVIDEISLQEVMRNRRSHFLVALRDLNRLLDPKLSEEKREQWKRILTTPLYFE